MNAPDRQLPPRAVGAGSLPSRVEATDWQAAGDALDQQGWAAIPGLLSIEECHDLSSLYELSEDAGRSLFRSKVVMARHGFGRGEYRYFAHPLPPLITTLREAAYAPLAAIANRWQAALGLAQRFPARHAEYIAQCHRVGQTRPTPLLLRYGPGDYNCLHQDLYGEQVFPLQMVLLLSEPGRDFDGGEFVMTEQRPRMQSRAMVLPLRQGDAAVIAVHQRPVQGSRGPYRVNLRHGVSLLRSGRRYTAGIIFHDAS
ncbi:2OG-Fe(II) oxygenase [Aquabacterium sp.]|uniref:2OG-Fe(II) oxygenase n=1 Tax=Aquabacterium sp. TaxID=1872578 RepID=UPI002D09579C|nr:2OG-Fe(II) oxygenase [Aquabacterium sp.]HSW03019.1 2OG-Fe(II) oxygenase [Aquabacterium sp.]